MEGIASWYGQPHHGRRAASGEVYNMHRLTAAHRTLPFHTIVRVHNKHNGREVNVRINDRGPFVKGRVIDLSYAAAKALDMLKPGTAPVRLKIVPAKARYPEPEFSVQVGIP
jgi:rare lipoprotein A